MTVGALIVILLQSCLIAALLWHSARPRALRELRAKELALRANERALRLSHEHARRLAGRIIAAQEVERGRIARELHDDLSQKVALLIIDIRQVSLGGPGMAGKLQMMAERAAELGTDLHNLSHELHPAKLTLLGLVRATQCLCRDMAVRHGLEIEFDHERMPGFVPADAALSLYRIVQEALQNIVKHSGAPSAAVSLSGLAGSLRLEISDSGSGFDALQPANGIGLLSMKERVHFLDGSMTIRSAPGAGTRITVLVPLSRSQADDDRRDVRIA